MRESPAECGRIGNSTFEIFSQKKNGQVVYFRKSCFPIHNVCLPCIVIGWLIHSLHKLLCQSGIAGLCFVFIIYLYLWQQCIMVVVYLLV